MRNLIIISVVFVITGIIGGSVGDKTNLFFGLAVWILLFGAFILQGLRKIPAQPPHKGVLTIFGKRKEIVKDEGWNFFPFYPFWHGCILVNVTKVNQDFAPQDVRTPDGAELDIRAAITWTPTNLIEFLNCGGEKGVRTIFDDIVPERLREWAFSPQEGPQTWEEAQGAREEGAAILLKAIAGETLTEIPFEAQIIPTTIWFKYFKQPKGKLTPKEAKVAGKNWAEIVALLASLSVQKQDEIKTAVEARRDEVIKARQGNGDFKKSLLGVSINRVNISDVKVKGELAKAIESETKEKQERKGEIFEVGTDLAKAQQLVDAATKKGEQLSITQAFQIVMEWKTTREGRGFTIPGISPVISEIAKIILGRRT